MRVVSDCVCETVTPCACDRKRKRESVCVRVKVAGTVWLRGTAREQKRETKCRCTERQGERSQGKRKPKFIL